MASYGLRINGKIFAMFSRGQFVVKLPKQIVDELVSSRKGKRFDPGHGRAPSRFSRQQSARSKTGTVLSLDSLAAHVRHSVWPNTKTITVTTSSGAGASHTATVTFTVTH